MKRLISNSEMSDSLHRARDRGDDGNKDLLVQERENINALVKKIAREDASAEAVKGASRRLLDAMALRYLRNREIFMKTFPDGIDNIDPDPVSIWAAIMISPRDEDPVSES